MQVQNWNLWRRNIRHLALRGTYNPFCGEKSTAVFPFQSIQGPIVDNAKPCRKCERIANSQEKAGPMPAKVKFLGIGRKPVPSTRFVADKFYAVNDDQRSIIDTPNSLFENILLVKKLGPGWCGYQGVILNTEKFAGYSLRIYQEAPLLISAVASGVPTLDIIHTADALTFLRTIPSESINCVVTSPPYFGLRDYGIEGQIGLEPTPQQFVATMVAVFREVRRVLRCDGTCWLNLGDSYANDTKWGGSTSGKHAAGLHGETGIGRAKRETGYKSKDLMMIPHRVAIALQDDGWYVRSDIIWHKPNPMPESVTDRPTKAHEYVFLLAKSERYYYDSDAIRETAVDGDSTSPRGSKGGERLSAGARVDKQGQLGKRTYTGFNERWDNRAEPIMTRNRRTVWTVPTEPTPFAHFATFPRKLIEPMILAGCPAGGTVLDPFMGSGTTALVARDNGRHYIGCDLNPAYVALARERLRMPFEDHHVVKEMTLDGLPLFALSTEAR